MKQHDLAKRQQKGFRVEMVSLIVGSLEKCTNRVDIVGFRTLAEGFLGGPFVRNLNFASCDHDTCVG